MLHLISHLDSTRFGLQNEIFSRNIDHKGSDFRQASSTEEIITTCSLSKKVNNVTCSTSDNLLGVNDHQRLSLSRFKYVFLFAQLLMGIGGAPLYTLGTAFIDENVSHKMQPIYSGNCGIDNSLQYLKILLLNT